MSVALRSNSVVSFLTFFFLSSVCWLLALFFFSPIVLVILCKGLLIYLQASVINLKLVSPFVLASIRTFNLCDDSQYCHKNFVCVALKN